MLFPLRDYRNFRAMLDAQPSVTAGVGAGTSIVRALLVELEVPEPNGNRLLVRPGGLPAYLR